jgi:hypothetical protein
MPPAHVFLEADWEIPQEPSAEEWEMPQEDRPLANGGGEDWEAELMVPAQGRLFYVGQGQSQYTFFHQPTPGLLYAKRKRKKRKKKASSTPQLPPPEPAPLSPTPIDWSDWEEMCQSAPPPPAPVGEDWEPEICPPSPREDWDAEISASQ